MAVSKNIEKVLNTLGRLKIGKTYTAPVDDNDAAPKKYIDYNFVNKSGEPVNQVTHGFSKGNAVYFNGTSWALAQSDNIATVGTKLVFDVTDADNFNIIDKGIIRGLVGLTSGAFYYVSDLVAGDITTTPGSIIINPIGQALSTTELDVHILRADLVESSLDDKTTRTEYDSTNSRYLYTGRADRGSLTSSAVWKISRFDFETGVTTFADGDKLFNNIWDNRESLTYI